MSAHLEYLRPWLEEYFRSKEGDVQARVDKAMQDAYRLGPRPAPKKPSGRPRKDGLE